jgi:hypothetical protein
LHRLRYGGGNDAGSISTVGVGSAAVPLQAVSKNKARMKILVIYKVCLRIFLVKLFF